MATFVLVHGAWHGAWCWFKVIPLLEKRGHTVIAVDLPSHGTDRTPTRDVSLELYAECVCRVLDECREPVMLVGHSMGGLVISRAAELRPAKIEKLVYVAAFLLPSGATIFETTSSEANPRAMTDLVINEDGSAAAVKPESIRHVFYADCEDSEVALARTLLVPQALAVSVTPLSTKDENWGRVPRFYVECTHDNAIPVETQRAMVARLPCQRVISLATSHSPFFSAPGELSAHLLQLLV
jgi:pimeloyl-ACP methyl ester carboxylesterase